MTEPLTLAAPHRIRWSLTNQVWRDVVFAHWPCDPALLEPMLPRGTRPDLFAGSAWIGLIGLRMTVSSVLGVPTLPALRDFNELNVRTYAVDERGRRGLVFLSMEASNRTFVRIARGSVQLPYRYAQVEFTHCGSEIGYQVRRGGVGLELRVRRGPRIAAGETERFDTSRWRMFSTWRGHALHTPAEHEPWALHSAELLSCADFGLISQLGLPAPDQTVALVASRVDARFGPPSRL
ncbi:YqjF family protein [Saccharopolyspora sp. NPDC002376]